MIKIRYSVTILQILTLGVKLNVAFLCYYRYNLAQYKTVSAKFVICQRTSFCFFKINNPRVCFLRT